jgi:arylsulfatase A-like enzyme
VTDASARDETYSLYGAGGPPFRLSDWEQLPVGRGVKVLMATLGRREAEGERTMIRTARWKLVHDPMGTDKDEFYDLESDPNEIRNLAGAPEFAAVELDLRQRLLAWRGRGKPSQEPLHCPA